MAASLEWVSTIFLPLRLQLFICFASLLSSFLSFFLSFSLFFILSAFLFFSLQQFSRCFRAIYFYFSSVDHFEGKERKWAEREGGRRRKGGKKEIRSPRGRCTHYRHLPNSTGLLQASFFSSKVWGSQLGRVFHFPHYSQDTGHFSKEERERERESLRLLLQHKSSLFFWLDFFLCYFLSFLHMAGMEREKGDVHLHNLTEHFTEW